MLSATIYIMACTAKNRALRRIQRLREPRYLVGAVVGGAYLVFVLFGRFLGMRRAGAVRGRLPAAPDAFLPAFGAAGPALAGLALLGLTSFSWLMPWAGGLVTFTASEKAILFSAPLSRRQLLAYRLIRSQWSSLFGAVIFAIAYPLASGPARLRGLIAGWLLLMTVHVFFAGVMLTRVRLRHATTSRQGFRRLPQLLTLGALTVVAGEVLRTARVAPVHTFEDVFDTLRTVSQGGLTHVVLTPFIAIVRPLFATSMASFVATMVPALLVYVATIAWVLASHEAVDLVAEHTNDEAERQAVARPVPYSSRPAAWTLALQGRPEGIFIWKAAQQTFRIVDRRVVVQFLVAACWVAVLLTLMGRTRGGGFSRAIAAFAGIAAAFATIVGPQIFRRDLRQDLTKLEILQTWPVRPAAVVRGEILWPAGVVTGVAWVLGLLSLVLSASLFSRAGLSMRMAVGSAALILVPSLVLVQFTIHNAAALLFPAWIPADGSQPRGVDAFGQRLILLGATWLVLLASLIPAVVVSGILGLVLYPFVGIWILVPSAGVAATILLFEVFLATESLGPAYESLDMVSVERIE